mgnify:CR=1 FL=1
MLTEIHNICPYITARHTSPTKTLAYILDLDVANDYTYISTLNRKKIKKKIHVTSLFSIYHTY